MEVSDGTIHKGMIIAASQQDFLDQTVQYLRSNTRHTSLSEVIDDIGENSGDNEDDRDLNERTQGQALLAVLGVVDEMRTSMDVVPAELLPDESIIHVAQERAEAEYHGKTSSEGTTAPRGGSAKHFATQHLSPMHGHTSGKPYGAFGADGMLETTSKKAALVHEYLQKNPPFTNPAVVARHQAACEQWKREVKTMVLHNVPNPSRTYPCHQYLQLTSRKTGLHGYERFDTDGVNLRRGISKRYTLDRIAFLHTEIDTKERAHIANLPMPFVPPRACVGELSQLIEKLRQFIGPARQDLYRFEKCGTFRKVYDWLYTVADRGYDRIWYSYVNRAGCKEWEIVVPITSYGMYIRGDFVAVFRDATGNKHRRVTIIDIAYCLVHDRLPRDANGRIIPNSISGSRWAFLYEEVRNHEYVSPDRFKKQEKTGVETPVLYRSSERTQDKGVVAENGAWGSKYLFGFILMRCDSVPHRQLDFTGLAFIDRACPLGQNIRGAFRATDWESVPYILKGGLGIKGRRPPQFTTDVASRTMIHDKESENQRQDKS